MVWLPRYSRQEDLPSTFFSKMFWARFYHCLVIVTYGTSTCIQFQKIKNKNKKTEKSPGDENNSIINLYGNNRIFRIEHLAKTIHREVRFRVETVTPENC